MKIPSKFKYMMPDLGGYKTLFEALEPPKSDPNAPGNPRHPVYGGINGPPHPPIPPPSYVAPNTPAPAPNAPKMAEPTTATPPTEAETEVPPTATPKTGGVSRIPDGSYVKSLFTKRAEELTPLDAIVLQGINTLKSELQSGTRDKINDIAKPSSLNTGTNL